jgi:hypothetical protein
VKALHEQDLAHGYGDVYLPNALAPRYPNTDREWGWQYAFPDGNRVTYTLAISASGTLWLQETTTVTAYTPSLAAQTQYAWRVLASDRMSETVGP